MPPQGTCTVSVRPDPCLDLSWWPVRTPLGSAGRRLLVLDWSGKWSERHLAGASQRGRLCTWLARAERTRRWR
eukprot:3482021-Pleurochrysis_carterae.AAC.1